MTSRCRRRRYRCQDASTVGGCGCGGKVLPFTLVVVAGFFGDVLGFFFFAGAFAPVAPPLFALGALLLGPPAPPSPVPAAAADFFFLEAEATEEDVGTVI